MGGIATISGVALVPGVSGNRRLYTPELIAKAAKRMQERIADPDALPIVMRTHHEAGDDSAKIVGRVTKVTVGEDNALRYEADLYDTFHGREIANLVTPKKPALRSVSIHGYWIGGTRQEKVGGQNVTIADDLEIDAIDFTATPGVSKALIDPVSKKTAETTDGRTPISESTVAQVAITEVSAVPAVIHDGEHVVSPDAVRKSWSVQRGRQYEPDPVTEAKYNADQMKAMLAKGHAMKNASGEPSYPIADKADLAKAIKAVGRGKSSHDAIRRHIIKRARALGAMDMIPDNWKSSGSNKETEVRLGEITEYYPDGPGGMAGFCIDAYAGPLSVTVRGCVSPDELAFAAKLATQAAMQAVRVMDPDADGDLLDSDDVDDNGNIIADDDRRTVLPDDDMESVKPKKLKMTQEQWRALAAEETRLQLEKLLKSTPSLEQWRKEIQAHSTQEGTGVPGSEVPDTTSSQPKAAESTQEEESAVSETTKAAEAAPARNMTDADVAAIGAAVGESVGNLLAEAIRAMGEQTTPKHAAPTQETVEPVPAPVAESTSNADEVATLKASLAALQEAMVTQRKELRNEFRDEFLAEKGLPPRRGYRVSENDEQEEQLTQSELFDKYRADIMLGDYGRTPSPQS